jgi:HAD domain in Swiss Army Knife RNA repair proteins
MGAKDDQAKPLLMVDIDGVISLFGFSGPPPWEECSMHTIDGIPHFLSRPAAGHLVTLAGHFDLVWASGWEEKADEYLPTLLGLPKGLPFLTFERRVGGLRSGNAHWKLGAIEEHAGTRALAWIDDSLDEGCHAWARERSAATLLVQTEPERGLTAREASVLADWAGGVTGAGSGGRPRERRTFVSPGAPGRSSPPGPGSRACPHPKRPD